jgi:hypothetical protein
MGDIQGSAVFTERNGWKLRMRLDRWWCDEPRALVRMANPSNAGAEWNDPTIHSLIRLTRRRPAIGGFTPVNWSLHRDRSGGPAPLARGGGPE